MRGEFGRTLVTWGFGSGRSIPRRDPDVPGSRQETGFPADRFGSGLESSQACEKENGFEGLLLILMRLNT